MMRLSLFALIAMSMDLLSSSDHQWRTYSLKKPPAPRLAHCMESREGRLTIFGGLSQEDDEEPQLSDELTLIPLR